MTNAGRPERLKSRAGLCLRSIALVALCAGATTALSPTATILVAQTKAKSVEGRVFGGNSQPLPGAIVYLQDQKTYIIKTFIATQDGSYRFGQLPPDTDYSLWAEYKGEKSKTRTISSFDTKLDTTYDFHLKSS